ncbi:hypothetical protein AF332_19875 [Sporosarcina globispora]|uniref:Uncharacterized protein n=1 Tax=Sporosarcina globispora TaxID=1459 RepID=A0A0M0GLS9_SPOGL|nr:hypothetical protein AF332_19875 [Sporosarcina globispora]
MYGNLNYVYQTPYNYPNRYPNNFYYSQNVDYYYARDPKFAELIGKNFTLIKPLILPTGQTLPANTSVFIHNVLITSTGEELVSIVTPGNEKFDNIPANQL